MSTLIYQTVIPYIGEGFSSNHLGLGYEGWGMRGDGSNIRVLNENHSHLQFSRPAVIYCAIFVQLYYWVANKCLTVQLSTTNRGYTYYHGYLNSIKSMT